GAAAPGVEDAVGGNRRRQDRGLRVRGELQVRLGPLEAELRQRGAENAVGFLEDGPALREGRGERLAHPDVLRSLAGEDEGDLQGPAASLRAPRARSSASMLSFTPFL